MRLATVDFNSISAFSALTFIVVINGLSVATFPKYDCLLGKIVSLVISASVGTPTKRKLYRRLRLRFNIFRCFFVDEVNRLYGKNAKIRVGLAGRLD